VRLASRVRDGSERSANRFFGGGIMKKKLMYVLELGLLGTVLALVCAGWTPRRAVAAPQGGQQAGERPVTVSEIPGVIAAGAKWKLVWQDPADNADGLVGTSDGSVIFGQEQGNKVGKIDKDDHYSVLVKDAPGAGAVGVDSKGRIIAALRTCFDPGGHPDDCKDPGSISEVFPEKKVLAEKFEDIYLGRPNKLIVDKNNGIYFNIEGALKNNPVYRPEATAGKIFYVSPTGKVSSIGENVHGAETISPDDKTLYASNGPVLVAFDIQPDGTIKNQRDFAKLEGGGNGDGVAIDAAGRVYVSSPPGVQVFAPDGKYLGVIPTPRPGASICFAGPDKKVLYSQGRGALGPDGKEYQTPSGVRNNAKSIYKIEMVAQGYKGRAQ
jgi:gluconolactonase